MCSQPLTQTRQNCVVIVVLVDVQIAIEGARASESQADTRDPRGNILREGDVEIILPSGEENISQDDPSLSGHGERGALGEF